MSPPRPVRGNVSVLSSTRQANTRRSRPEGLYAPADLLSGNGDLFSPL